MESVARTRSTLSSRQYHHANLGTHYKDCGGLLPGLPMEPRVESRQLLLDGMQTHITRDRILDIHVPIDLPGVAILFGGSTQGGL